MFQMPIRLGVLLLILVQPAAAVAGGVMDGRLLDGGQDDMMTPVSTSPTAKAVDSRDGTVSDSALQTGQVAVDTPLSSRSDRPQVDSSPESKFEFVPILSDPEMPVDGSFGPSIHRGLLSPSEYQPSRGAPRGSSGPNTPPPANGSWIIDQPGNNVNNTTIVLNGDLLITAGNLTLFNVTLIMNCTSDGQYQINVSAGAELNASNTTITAYDGSIHYKFLIHGKMIMRGCNVSEMWGIAGSVNDYRRGGGISVFSNDVEIYNTTISNSQSNGIQIHGSSFLRLGGCTVQNNLRSGLMGLDDASGAINENIFCNNSNHGASIYFSSYLTFINCIFTGNYNGITTWNNASPVFENCISSKNRYHGIYVNNTSDPIFNKCSATANQRIGIVVRESAAPNFTNCISTYNAQVGFYVCDDPNDTTIDARPRLTNCTATGNTNYGYQLGGNTTSYLACCTADNNDQTGFAVLRNAKSILFNCRSEYNKEHGIGLADKSSATIIDCIANNNYWNGITVVSELPSNLTGCQALNNTGEGIRISVAGKAMLKDCRSIGNNKHGILSLFESGATISNCTISNNWEGGLWIGDDGTLSIDNTTFSGNGYQSICSVSRSIVNINDSILSDSGREDINISNQCNLTFLNTTFNGWAKVSESAHFNVNWYLRLNVCARDLRPIKGAVVNGTGMNGSSIQSRISNDTGFIENIIIRDYTQNPGYPPVKTEFNPYNFTILVDGEINTTSDVSIHRTIYEPPLTLYYNYAPKILYIPDFYAGNESSTEFNIGRYIFDADNDPVMLGIDVDKQYVTVDNSSKYLKISFPPDLKSDIIQVTVSDGLRQSAQSMNIYRSQYLPPPNTRPIFKGPILDQCATEDVPFVFECSDYFFDIDSPRGLNYTCNNENSSTMIVNYRSGTLRWNPKEEDESLLGVKIIVSDGIVSTESNPFNITLDHVNDRPFQKHIINDTTVPEHTAWRVDLFRYFEDEENTAGMWFEATIKDITINNTTHQAIWAPTGNNPYPIHFYLIAHDSVPGGPTTLSNLITLTYCPIDDAPICKGHINDTNILGGSTWRLRLSGYFDDEDPQNLTYSVNYSNIITIDNTTKIAFWKTPNSFMHLQNITIYASDANNTTSSNEFWVLVIPNRIIQPPQWYLYLLLPIGILGGIIAIQSYRKVKYGRYEIEQLFLIYNDGRLLAHRQKKDTAQVSNDILTGMLTALKGFIKESLRDQSQGELDEMKYGNLKIALEQGENVYLAAFISGYVTDRLKADMKTALRMVEKDFEPVLKSWDGMMPSVEGAGKYLDELINTPGH